MVGDPLVALVIAGHRDRILSTTQILLGQRDQVEVLRGTVNRPTKALAAHSLAPVRADDYTLH